MARLRFESLDVEVEIAPGTRVIDFTDEASLAALPSACRDANCGLCLIVAEPADAFEPPLSKESATLAALKAPVGGRLGCQLTVSRCGETPGVIRRAR